MAREYSTNVLVVGGGLGGCAAALAAARLGYQVVLAEETDWIGGQLTSQAVPPDEHGWIESLGCTASYRRFRDAVRNYYRSHYPLTEAACSERRLNPGSGWVSPLCHEPRVALTVLEGFVQPYLSSGAITLLLCHRPVVAEVGPADRVTAVTLCDRNSRETKTVVADYVLDATDLGDLLPLAGAEFVVGSESRQETEEPSALDTADEHNVQAMSVCFAVDYLAGEDHTIEKPEQYEYWREFVPSLEPAWPGRLFSWESSDPRTLGVVRHRFDPADDSGRAFGGLWTYRRIVAKQNFVDGAYRSDICTVNWPMIDYLGGHALHDSAEENARHVAGARQLSLSFLYWLQTEAPRPDGSVGYRGLRLRSDVVGTKDGLAKTPYIRESRRIRAEFTVCQQHVDAVCRPADGRAEPFADSVGIGSYRIDLHPTTGGCNYLDVAALPFQIPLGSLIPIRLENLLPAAKNLGVTHITGGCYRLHPVEWNVGEAAGLLAAYCLSQKTTPRAVYQDEKRRQDFQRLLVEQGIELAWPTGLVLEDGDPHVHAR